MMISSPAPRPSSTSQLRSSPRLPSVTAVRPGSCPHGRPELSLTATFDLQRVSHHQRSARLVNKEHNKTAVFTPSPSPPSWFFVISSPPSRLFQLCMNILFLSAATAPNLQGTFKWILLCVKAQLSSLALRNVHNGGVLLKEYREVSLCNFLPFGLIPISPASSHLGRGMQWHMHHLYVCQLQTRPRYCDMGPWATTSSKAPTFCKNYHTSSIKKNAVTACTSVFFNCFFSSCHVFYSLAPACTSLCCWIED